MKPRILMREGTLARYPWRQYMVVTDKRVAIIEMKPAYLGGWNIDSVTIQGDKDWPGMTRDAIVAWKFEGDDGRTREIDPADIESFLPTLLTRAGVAP